MSKNEIEKVVAEFHKVFPRPGIDSLKIDWYDLSQDRASPWPNGNKPGVYIFLGSDESLLYIGKASSGRNLKTRLRGYFDFNKNVKNSEQGKKALGTRYIGLLGLPAEHGFEAAAIEEYLVTVLSPPRNKVIVQKNVRKSTTEIFKEWYKNPEKAPLEIQRILDKTKA